VPDPFVIILFFVFFVLPLIERALKKGQPPQQPPQRQRRPREVEEAEDTAHALPPSARTGGREPPRETGAGHDPAADMIPDDLWEVLTGEKRQRPTTPQRPPEVEPERGEWFGGFEIETRDDETALEGERVYDTEVGDEIASSEIAADEDAAAERLRQERERAVHTAERAPERLPSEVVLYEPRAPTAPLRPLAPVAAARIRELPPADVHYAQTAPAGVRMAIFGGLDRAALKRAFILKEILDRPRGLE
jgi:hypothetical protein